MRPTSSIFPDIRCASTARAILAQQTCANSQHNPFANQHFLCLKSPWLKLRQHNTAYQRQDCSCRSIQYAKYKTFCSSNFLSPHIVRYCKTELPIGGRRVEFCFESDRVLYLDQATAHWLHQALSQWGQDHSATCRNQQFIPKVLPQAGKDCWSPAGSSEAVRRRVTLLSVSKASSATSSPASKLRKSIESSGI